MISVKNTNIVIFTDVFVFVHVHESVQYINYYETVLLSFIFLQNTKTQANKQKYQSFFVVGLSNM